MVDKKEFRDDYLIINEAFFLSEIKTLSLKILSISKVKRVEEEWNEIKKCMN